jgi:hypothetical protein
MYFNGGVLQNITADLSVNKSAAFYRIWRFITNFKKALSEMFKQQNLTTHVYYANRGCVHELGVYLLYYRQFVIQQYFMCLLFYRMNIQIESVFYILLTVHLDIILANDQLDALFLNVFISCLYMFRAASAHHQEGQIVSIHHLV